MLRVFGFALAALHFAAQAEAEKQIVGYHYTCEASIWLVSGRLAGRRTLNESTHQLIDSDFASWSPQTYSGVSLSWASRPLMTATRLSDIPGSVTIHVRTQRRLPKVASWVVRRSAILQYDELLVPMIRAADTKFGAATIPVDALLAYSGASDKLAWRLIDPRPGPDGRQRAHAEGEIDIASIREASQSIS